MSDHTEVRWTKHWVDIYGRAKQAECVASYDGGDWIAVTMNKNTIRGEVSTILTTLKVSDEVTIERLQLLTAAPVPEA